MLSKEDYNREIGKNIFIYPLDFARILGNSIDLTASEFAWTSDGKYIYDDVTGKISVPPHETACVLTREAIYVKSNIGGTYHSRVSMAKKGFSHVGTMLDPEFFGQSLIVLHNTTNKALEIDAKNHERIVSIIFYYLNTPILIESHKPNPGHVDKIEHFENFDLYKKWNEENRWASEKRELVNTFMTSEGYKDFIIKRDADENAWGDERKRRWKVFVQFLRNNALGYILLVVLSYVAFKVCFMIFPQSAVDQRAEIMAMLIVVLITKLSQDIKTK